MEICMGFCRGSTLLMRSKLPYPEMTMVAFLKT